jgi:hypothetical protein
VNINISLEFFDFISVLIISIQILYTFYRFIFTYFIFLAGCWWLTPINLATWEAEIGRIVVQASLGKSNQRKEGWRHCSSNKSACLSIMKLHVQTPVASKKKKSYYLQHRKTNTPCSHLYVKSKKKVDLFRSK